MAEVLALIGDGSYKINHAICCCLARDAIAARQKHMQHDHGASCTEVTDDVALPGRLSHCRHSAKNAVADTRSDMMVKDCRGRHQTDWTEGTAAAGLVVPRQMSQWDCDSGMDRQGKTRALQY